MEPGKMKPWDGYPLTVATDRYSGVYSRGEWIAFALHPSEVPLGPWSCDRGAASYWAGIDSIDESGKETTIPEESLAHPKFVGLGRTPEEAIQDLRRRMGGLPRT